MTNFKILFKRKPCLRAEIREKYAGSTFSQPAEKANSFGYTGNFYHCCNSLQYNKNF